MAMRIGYVLLGAMVMMTVVFWMVMTERKKLATNENPRMY
jgi:hypothetical protein